jgi:hypothetical protein
MKWFEVVEELGDGYYALRRFKTKEAAEAYVDKNEEWCQNGFYEVDTESKYFYFEE